MKISDIITDKYKLRIPPTVYYDLLADVQEVEEDQEPILDKVRAEIKQGYCEVNNDYDRGRNYGLYMATQIIDKYKAESE